VNVVLPALLLLVAAAGGSRLAAQSSASVDAGGTHVSYDGDVTSSSLALTPAFGMDGEAASVTAWASMSRLDDGEWSTQGAAEGSLFTPTFGPFQGEIGGAFDASGQPGQPGTGQFAGSGRLHWSGGDNRGVWLGGEAGRASDGFSWRTIASGELGVWARAGDVTLVGRGTPTWVGDTIRYLDGQVVARLERGAFEMNTYLGLRSWSSSSDRPSTGFGGLNAAMWISDHMALLGGMGKYPADYVEGFPSGNYLTLGVRLATRRPTSRQALARTAPQSLPPLAPESGGDFRILPAHEGSWTLEIHAPEASTVELMGDFTDWAVAPLSQTRRGWWTITLPIAAGTHRMNLRLDGGRWGVPSGLPVLTDEFSGTAALLTVE
jgi:hypothetical protein